ncbi:MAG: M20/M25/M40 family metallo-hydrolase [Oscillospiraceae bacterium]|nr:M20/M25/M40 family metallo-hydrolase [Oscillospiraceae bacterium]
MVLLFILVALFAVILVRTFRFSPKPEEEKEFDPVEFDRDACVASLAALVKCRTVSYEDSSLEEDAEFEKLISLLPALFPRVWETCTLQRFPGRALLFCWKGKTDGDPAVLMAHYDVVPVEEENWLKPPFEAIVEDGVLWGRGTLDTKVTFNGILSAAENLISQGYQPENDIYFAFSGGEEINGPGAKNIVQWLAEQGRELKLVLDEGGAVVEDVFPGVKGQCALIGIAEKGVLNLEYSISGAGGHASAPKPHTPVGELAMACTKLEAHPFQMHFTRPVLEMFDTLGRHSGFLYRMIFANLWAFGWVLNLITRKSGGELNALLRTTVAFTQMRGSKAPNVIPPSASMVSDLRLNPADSVDSAVAYIKKVIGNENITLKKLKAIEPSPISRTDCEGWEIVAGACSGTWKGCIVSPYLMVQCSDSRHYGPISDKVYRFCAMDMTAEERSLIHGNNERIRLESVSRAVEFFLRVMKQL